MKKFVKSILILLVALQVMAANPTAKKPYLLIISFDGFRWDYPDRGLTPTLDKLARQGVRALTFEPAFPSKTFPNHYSIVTGLYPQNHGLIYNRFFNPFTNEKYQVGDTLSVYNAKWYGGEALWETSEKQGVISASFFWPGSEMHLAYRHPLYSMHYNGSVTHEARIQGIIDWLQLPEKKRPHLLFLYFSDTDTQGHRYGPDSPQINQAIHLLDQKLGLLLQRLKAIGMQDKINIILVSDHGMTNLLPDGQILLYKKIEGEKVRYSGYGPLVQFYTSTPKEKNKIFNLLNKNHKRYSVYKKENIPDYFHYKESPFIGDVIAVADLGYSFVRTKEELKEIKQRKPKGDHGYDNHTLDMQGIFFAVGPAFRKNYRCATILNIDVYPLACKVLGIIPNQKIDGRLERIDYILR